MVADLGSPLSPCQVEFVMYRSHGEPKKNVQPFSVMVISVYARDSAKNFEELREVLGELTKVLQEGRKEGAIRFFIAGDLNSELGFGVHGR